MFTRFCERLILICQVRMVHHAFCSPENGTPIWFMSDVSTRYWFRNDDPRGIPIIPTARGRWVSGTYTHREYRRLEDSIRHWRNFRYLRYNQLVYSSCSYIRTSFALSWETQWNSNFGFDVEFTEREMRKPEWTCLHASMRIWTKMPLWRQSGSADILILAFCLIRRKHGYAADEKPIIYFLEYCES